MEDKKDFPMIEGSHCEVENKKQVDGKFPCKDWRVVASRYPI
jgi:hypothetical protein